MLPGEIIGGKYVVERVLGKGGMGTVVAARHRVYNTPVAVKVLRADACDPTHVRRFFREVRGASQLQGDHVARVYDFGRHGDGRPFMAMELLDGPDLDTVLGTGALSPRLAISYIVQACRGLGVAHALGIVHRDIKPANLMLTRAPTGEQIIKVVDFGIATASRDDHDDDITAAHIVIGSITYMSPEQLRSAHDLDARSDIWSLGVTLYELLSGRVPFEGENFAAVAVQIATDRHTPLYEVDPALAKIVDRCLEKEPEARYASVEELATALEQFASARAPQASYSQTIRMHVPAAPLLTPQWSEETMIVSRDSVLEWPPTPPRLESESPAKTRRRSPKTLLAIAAAAAVVLGLGIGGALGGSNRVVAANPMVVASPEPTVVVEPIHLAQLPATAPAAAAVESAASEIEIEIDPAPVAPRPIARHAAKPVKHATARKAGVRFKAAPTCDRTDRRCGL